MKKYVYLISVMILFSPASYGQWSSSLNLSGTRVQQQSARMGDDLFFIAGNDGYGSIVNTVDIYHTLNSTWSTTHISTPRCITASVGGDSALYVAGGLESFSSNPSVGSDKVDIYKNGTWSTHTLPDSVWNGNAVHVGSKILFGGFTKSYDQYTGLMVASKKVYVYDELTGAWSADSLSAPRSGCGAATDGIIALFAGGFNGHGVTSNVVDIYNSVTGTWSTATLSIARAFPAAVYAAGKFYFAGGAQDGTNNSSKIVDIYDGTQWTTDSLSVPRAGITPCAAGNLIFFPGGGDMNMLNYHYSNSQSVVDVYNTNTGLWTVNQMHYDKINQTAISAGSKIYVAGGYSFTTGTLQVVEVWDINSGIHPFENAFKTAAYPNPASDMILFKSSPALAGTQYRILDVYGRQVLSGKITGETTELSIRLLSSGIYFIQLADFSEHTFIKN